MKIDVEKIQPKCPYCEKTIDRLIEVKRGFFAINRVLCCPSCHKIVGISAGTG